MKKCLTVLLVIAVMFTFSFGSAFAATNHTYTYDQANELLDETAKDLISTEKTKMDAAVVAYKAKDETDKVKIESVTISADAMAAYYQDLYDEYCEELQAEVDDQKDYLDKEYADGTRDFTDKVGGKFDTTALTDEVITYPSSDTDFSTEDQKKAIVEAEFDVTKAGLLADLEDIDLDVYSTTKEAGASETPKETAERLVNQAIAQANGYSVATGDTASKIATKIGYLEAIYTPGEGTAKATGALATGTPEVDNVNYAPGLNNLATSSEEVKDDAKLEFSKSRALAALTSDINAAEKNIVDKLENKILAERLKDNPDSKKIAEWEAEIEDAKADYAKILEVVTYYVEYQDDYEALATFRGDTFGSVVLSYKDTTGLTKNTATVDTKDPAGGIPQAYDSYTKGNMIEMADAVADAEAEAELAKATIDIAGETYVEIDRLLEEAIEDIYIYGVTAGHSFTSTAEDYLYHYVENTLINGGVDGVRINTVDYDGINSWYVAGNYDAAKQAEAKAAANAAKAAVRAASTVEEAQAAFLDAWEDFDAIVTKTEHTRDFTYSTGQYKDAYKDTCAELTAYAGYKNDIYNADGAYEKDAAESLAAAYTTANTGKFYTECFNDAELASMLDEAKDAIDNLKTKDTLKSEAAAIEADIDALPKLADITLADKAEICAVFDDVLAHNGYCEDIGDDSNDVRTGTINMLVEKLAELEEEALTDAHKAIMKDDKVTIEEAAQVEALRADYDAYVEYWDRDGYDDFYDATILDSGNDVEAVEDDLLTAQVKEVVRIINELPATGASSTEVKAAVDAFNALGRDGRDALYHSYARAYSKLIDLQKLVLGSDEFVKAYLQDLSIVARSVKTASGNIKVTINADVQPILDAGYTVEYKFYRSTKPRSNYGKARMIKTENVYTNTSGTKGVRYYYKAMIQVKDAEGNIVATTPLSQCKYACRIK